VTTATIAKIQMTIIFVTVNAANRRQILIIVALRTRIFVIFAAVTDLLSNFDIVLLRQTFQPFVLFHQNSLILTADDTLFVIFGVPPITEFVLINQPIIADNFCFPLLSEKIIVHRFLNGSETERRSKVHSFSNVEAVREPCVIGFEECANVVTLSLMCFVNGNSNANELERVEHEGDAVEQVGSARSVTDVLIELLFELLRNDVPRFCIPFMIVIDGVQPQILHVPAESGEHHSHVHPWRGHSANVLLSTVCNFEYRHW
jgi:hypothetical protein